MPSTMLVHDRRLTGNAPPNAAANTYLVDGSVSVEHAISWIGTYARRSRRLSSLSIMCHGYESHSDLGHGMSLTSARGGFGLQFCREGLTLYNVSRTSSWKGQIDRITLFACSPADTAPYNVGTAGDGRRFCGEMALWTEAEVIAATQTQTYFTSQTFWQWLTGQNRDGTIDFGDWEGSVYSFTTANPNGRRIR